MTKSKVFLGATAFALAIAGALSTKASNKLVTQTGYTINGQRFGQVTCQLTGTHICKKSNLTLYTVNKKQLRTNN